MREEEFPALKSDDLAFALIGKYTIIGAPVFF
jgi:hypothetical protein